MNSVELSVEALDDVAALKARNGLLERIIWLLGYDSNAVIDYLSNPEAYADRVHLRPNASKLQQEIAFVDLAPKMHHAEANHLLDVRQMVMAGYANRRANFDSRHRQR